MTSGEYYTEIENIANELQRQYEADEITALYEALHEYIDKHRWVVYSAYTLDVLKYSSHESYGTEEGLVDTTDFWKMMSGLAFWAMFQDVNEYLSK
jgi:hypothetical protein